MRLKEKYQSQIKAILPPTSSGDVRLVFLVSLMRDYVERFISFLDLDPEDLADMLGGPFWLLIQCGADQCFEEIKLSTCRNNSEFVLAVEKMNERVVFYSRSDRSGIITNLFKDDLRKCVTSMEKALGSDRVNRDG